MVAAGGRTVVELTWGGLKPDPAALADISRTTGAHIVMGCGHYVDDYQDKRNHERDGRRLRREMIAQVLDGAWGTDVRAGIIGEIGCQAPWTELERRVMQGALIAQQETGAAINVHPGRHEDQPQEVADFFLARRADGSHGRSATSTARSSTTTRLLASGRHRLRDRIRPVRDGAILLLRTPTSTCRTTRYGCACCAR